MKSTVTVSVHPTEDQWRTLRELLATCGLLEHAEGEPGICTVSLDSDSSALRCLLTGLETSRALAWSYLRENVYDEDELRAAPLLRLIVDRAPQGVGGPALGTEYDLARACPHCGSGARQVSPLRVQHSELPKRGPIFQMLTGEILVSERLRDAITAVEPMGLELREALRATTSAGTGWFQLLAEPLPPMSRHSEGVLRESSCPECGRDGHFDSLRQPMRIVYRADDLGGPPYDAYSTWELFGNGVVRTPLAKSSFAQPILLMSGRLHEVFVKQRVPNVKFEPVAIL